MNFLAHLLCSFPTPERQVGSFIADFVKGDVSGRFPRGIAAGIVHHRQADSFTDGHADFRASRKLISPERRRYAGIIIDVLYDHFLTASWQRYSSVGLDEFVRGVYGNLERYGAQFPGMLRLVLEKAVQEDWLRSYGTGEGLDRTFRRISRRLRRENPLGTALVELEPNYAALHDHFHRFFPQLLATVALQTN